ncbi:MAG: hypothetical protein Q3974_00575 [Rothia sp. (in: high G+C Gram-positive bacteria)]|nr:hypothetical protein [Rothia sp. (in: high G+C Gram-positive bacteria)]
MKNQQTGIKEIAYRLAKKHGWNLEYNGGIEIDGEFLDDADLSWVATHSVGVPVEYVLNISWADSTAYGLTLTQEDAAPTGGGTPQVGSAFGLNQSAFGAPAENNFSNLPSAGETLVEKYFLATLNELETAVEEAVKNLS